MQKRQKHSKMAEKMNKNANFFTKLFDIYKNYCNFAQNFSDKPIKKLNV